MGNGLELMLDIQQDEYLPVWGETGEKKPIHVAVCHTGAIEVLVFVGVDTSEPETLLRVWILSETHFYSDPKRFAFLQMKLRLKRGSKFRSTVRTSRPSLTSSDSEWHPGSRHLFPVRNRGYKLLLINSYQLLLYHTQQRKSSEI